MAFQTSDTVANATLDAVATAIGATPLVDFYTLPVPANPAASPTGTRLARITLPSTWMNAAASRSKAGTGLPWTDSSADASGLVAFYRVMNAAGTVCHLQGLVGETWQASKAYLLNQQVIANGNLYRCITAGTSASSGGPSGTGADITDGTAHWQYIEAAGQMTMDNGNLVAGQEVKVTSYQWAAGNA